MKKIILSIIFCFLILNTFSQTPIWQWEREPIISGGYPSSNACCTDMNGNVFVVGRSTTTIIFGNDTLTNTGGYIFFVVKYDSNGNVLWARKSSGIAQGNATSICSDANGNVYIAGYFNAPILTFDSVSVGEVSPYNDIFLVKYDSSGTAMWVRTSTTGYDGYADGVCIDKNGNVLIVGYYDYLLTLGGVTLPSTTSFTAFVAKFDSLGTVLWAKSAGGDDYEYGKSVAVDSSGNVYIAGYFDSDKMFFGIDTLDNNFLGGGTDDIFIAKYDIFGNYLWSKNFGTSGRDRATSIKVDFNGNLFMTGSCGIPIVFGGITLSGSSGTNIYVVKFDNFGNALWAKRAGGTSIPGYGDFGKGLALDPVGSVYVTGDFVKHPNIYFESIVLPHLYNEDIFVVKYNTLGYALWAKRVAGNDYDLGAGICTDNSGGVYITGHYASTSISFDTISVASTPNYNIFLAKLVDSISILTDISNKISNDRFTLSPNPFSFETTIDFYEEQLHTQVVIWDLLGKEIKTFNFSGKQLRIQKGEMRSGVYFIQITDEKKNVFNRKIIVQ